ncbi:MAG TPA: hypothetical protein VHE35_23460, partial [Kofleriaceae bacterium]|nr:hypothetical protein [Kofleriaceae bacterium]
MTAVNRRPEGGLIGPRPGVTTAQFHLHYGDWPSRGHDARWIAGTGPGVTMRTTASVSLASRSSGVALALIALAAPMLAVAQPGATPPTTKPPATTPAPTPASGAPGATPTAGAPGAPGTS